MISELSEDWEKRDTSTPIPVHIAAGCLAGLSEHITMLPFDNVKTRLQVYSNAHMLAVMKEMSSKGPREFFKGISAASAGCMPAHALFFSFYEFTKVLTNVDDEQHHPFIFAVIGATSTFFHDLLMTPFDVVKQRTQIMQIPSSEIFKTMIQKEGVISLFRSFPITYFSNAPNQAIIFSANETLKLLIATKDEHNAFTHSLCGGVAGGIATLFTNPFDVIKTKLQTQTCHLSESQQLKEIIKYTNLSTTIKIIMKEEGWKGFYKGVIPRFLMQAPSSAVAWGTYETVKRYLFARRQY